MRSVGRWDQQLWIRYARWLWIHRNFTFEDGTVLWAELTREGKEVLTLLELLQLVPIVDRAYPPDHPKVVYQDPPSRLGLWLPIPWIKAGPFWLSPSAIRQAWETRLASFGPVHDDELRSFWDPLLSPEDAWKRDLFHSKKMSRKLGDFMERRASPYDYSLVCDPRIPTRPDTPP